MLSEIAIHDPMTFDSLAAHVPGAHKPHVEALAK
jgi:ribosomal protein L20